MKSPLVDTIEQAMCRQRTDEEQRAVDMCTVFRHLIDSGIREIDWNPDPKPLNVD